MNGVNANLACALRGPIVMITIGTLFLLDRFSGLNFGETWPLILIVLGVLALMGAGRRRPAVPPDFPPRYPPRYPPPPNYPPDYAANVPPPHTPPPGARR